MGACSGKQRAGRPEVKTFLSRAQERVGEAGISGRYYHSPKRIQDDYELSKKVLGTGANGCVFQAKCKQTGIPVAVKGFQLAGLSPDLIKDMEMEVENFLTMDHPHVARLLGVYECDRHLNLVVECMEGGELFSRVEKRKRFSEGDAANAVSQMLLAVNYLHGRGVVHRDLKLENFMYESEDGEFLKLIDFGLSHYWEPNTKMASSVGTIAYVAPEVLSKSYTSKCDVWSLGVITFILLAGYMPFSGVQAHMISSIQKGSFVMKPNVWNKVSGCATDFVTSLLTTTPQRRPTVQKALEHQWIARLEQRKAGTPVDECIVDALCAYADTSRFRRACMSVMAWSLNREERQRVREEFLKLDIDKTGTITLGEFKQVLTTNFNITDDKIVPIFNALDSTNSEEIHYTEFLAAMVSTRIVMHDDLLTQAFRRFDVENTGYITAKDLTRVFGESFDGAQIDELLREADVQEDGRMSYDQFIKHLKEGGATDIQTAAADKMVDEVVLRRQKTIHSDMSVRDQCMPDGFLGLEAHPPCTVTSPVHYGGA